MLQQFIFQRFLPLDIQMVGGLIEQIEVWLGKPQPIGHYAALVGRDAITGGETARKLSA